MVRHLRPPALATGVETSAVKPSFPSRVLPGSAGAPQWVLRLSPNERAGPPNTRLVVEAISKLHPEVPGSKDLSKNRPYTGGITALLASGLLLLSLLVLLLLAAATAGAGAALVDTLRPAHTTTVNREISWTTYTTGRLNSREGTRTQNQNESYTRAQQQETTKTTNNTIIGGSAQHRVHAHLTSPPPGWRGSVTVGDAAPPKPNPTQSKHIAHRRLLRITMRVETS